MVNCWELWRGLKIGITEVNKASLGYFKKSFSLQLNLKARNKANSTKAFVTAPDHQRLITYDVGEIAE